MGRGESEMNEWRLQTKREGNHQLDSGEECKLRDE